MIPEALREIKPCRTDVVQIYVLVDPRDDAVRYVGQTVDPHQRLKAHCHVGMIYEANVSEMWLRELRRAGLKPRMFIVQEDVPKHHAILAEHWWCDYFEARGEIHNYPYKGERFYPAPQPGERQYPVHAADVDAWAAAPRRGGGRPRKPQSETEAGARRKPDAA